MGFGALRVINDDAIAPANGFGPHGHRDMEIITLVTEGAVTHEDSMGNKGTVKAGEVQVMSAGTGLVHAERNDSAEVPLKLFQIWITPNAHGLAPRYAQSAFSFDAPGAALLVAPLGKEGSALGINQDAYVTLVNITDEGYAYALHNAAHGAYVFVVAGTVTAAGVALSARDALGVTGEAEIRLTAKGAARLIIFEVPMA
jgi:redox-sensitive bicupin YhaK (pirin superfamily)